MVSHLIGAEQGKSRRDEIERGWGRSAEGSLRSHKTFGGILTVIFRLASKLRYPLQHLKSVLLLYRYFNEIRELFGLLTVHANV